MKDYIKIIEKILEERYSIKGLIILMIIAIPITKSLKDITPSQLSNNSYFCVVTYIIFLCAITITWYIKRQVPKFKENEIGIIVSFHSIRENQNYAKQLKQAICYQLQNNLRGIKYKISSLPPNYHIKTPEEANSLGHKTNAHLIIWGTVNEAKDAQKGKAIFLLNKSLNLTFKFKSNINSNFLSDAFSLFKPEATIYHENNEYIEEPIVRDNITKTAQFVLAKCLAINFQYDDALMILERIKQEHTDINTSKLISIVNSNIKIIHYYRAVYLYYNYIYVDGNFKVENNVIQNILTDIAYFKKDIPIGLIGIKASLLVLQLKFKEAKKILKLFSATDENKYNLNNISLAFIALWGNNIDLAMKLFIKINFSYLTQNNISHILDFYYYFITAFPNKFCYLYGLAYINMKCMDKKLAQDYFQKFISHPKNTLKHWKNQARKYIKECEL